MQLAELKHNIVNNKLDNFYLFAGPEIKIMDTYIKMICKTFDLEIVRADSLSSIYSKLNSKSLINKRRCYVVSSDEDYIKEEKIWDKLFDLKGENVLIMTYYNLDKRTRFYKYHIDYLTDFEKLPKDVLLKYIQKDIQLSTNLAEELIGICDGDYSRILLEIDKIKCYSEAASVTHNNAYSKLIDEGVIYVPVKDLLFPFIDAVTLGNANLSYTIWEKIRKVENSMAILSLLYNNFRSILIVQLAGNVKGICEYTGLTPWQVKLAKEKMGIFNKQELLNILHEIRFTEKGIKIGQVEEPVAIDYVLTCIFKEV